MARKMFTQEQVRVMAENPYTLHVSTTQITFTNAFKEEFWRRYQEGDTPRTIMYDLGYDPEVLGRNRLSGIQNMVCKQAVSAKGFHERPQRRRGEGYPDGETLLEDIPYYNPFGTENPATPPSVPIELWTEVLHCGILAAAGNPDFCFPSHGTFGDLEDLFLGIIRSGSGSLRKFFSVSGNWKRGILALSRPALARRKTT